MTTEQVFSEDKKTKKKRWQQIIDAAKEALENNDNTKKGIIKKTAELLEKNWNASRNDMRYYIEGVS